MLAPDPALPAVAHLTGPSAHDVVGAAVDVAGGTLHRVEVRQVQYRPGTDLIVRYRADVTWAGGRRERRDTILAATGRGEALPGTIPVHGDGGLVTSVWRYPFDPVLTGLPDAVTPGGASDLLDPLIGPSARLDVVAYRPTERAVVLAEGPLGRAYLKVVPPAALDALADRHRRLRVAGLPAPLLLGEDPARGILALAEVAGPTFRDQIKVGGATAWPTGAELRRVLDALGAVEPSPTDGPHRAGRTADAVGHARLLATAMPELVGQLADLSAVAEAQADLVAARWGPVVHHDLHEGQLVLADDGRIVGVLDVDDVGPGDPVDDPATLLGHLRYRVLAPATDPATARALDRHATALRADLLAHGHEARPLDQATGAVLVGLATGPFRIQQDDWRTTAGHVLDLAAELLGAT